MRAPDFGFTTQRAVRVPRETWAAWRIPTPDLHRGIVLGRWLLQCPFAHPVWSQWVLSLVHLRPVDGMPPPVGVGHSLAIFAVDPRVELVADGLMPALALLAPAVELQFSTFGADDGAAVERVEALIEMTMRRDLSPDDDCRRVWEALLRAPRRGLEHVVRAGG